MATVLNVTNDAVVQGSGSRYVDLPAIAGGALIATAISIVLATFGSALGLSSTSAEPGEGLSLRWVAIAGGIWLIWMAVSSSIAGGYFAGRLRKLAADATPDEVETRDGAHGLATWALATIFTVLLTAAGTTGTLKAAGSALSASESLQETIRSNVEQATGLALRSESAIASDSARSEFSRVLSRSLDDDEISDADRAYLASIVANETNLSRADARSRVDELVASALKSRDEAIEAAEQARIFGVIAGFIIAASMLVSAAASWFAAIRGGQHRNENIGFGGFLRARPPVR